MKLDLRISPIVNLYYHLERGGLSKRYLYAPLEGYRSKALDITDRNLLDQFSFLLDQEYIHSIFVNSIGRSDTIREANESLVVALADWANDLNKAINHSWQHYIRHFEDDIKPDLEEFTYKLQRLTQEIEERMIRAGNILGFHWGESYNLYIVEPTSSDFKPCGDVIYGGGATIEAHLDLPHTEIVDLVIHELSHSTFDSTILRLLPERLRADYEGVKEAIIFLITNTALGRLKLLKMEECEDERSRKVASFVIPFLETWQKRLVAGKVDQESFEDFLKRLMADVAPV